MRHKEDKRVWTIELDEKGTEVVELVIDHIRKVFSSFSSHHDPEELEKFLGFLREFVQFYQEIINKKR